MKLWRLARDPEGCSVEALSEAPGLERAEVVEVACVLRDEGLREEVGIGPGRFIGWVSSGSGEVVKELVVHIERVKAVP